MFVIMTYNSKSRISNGILKNNFNNILFSEKEIEHQFDLVENSKSIDDIYYRGKRVNIHSLNSIEFVEYLMKMPVFSYTNSDGDFVYIVNTKFTDKEILTYPAIKKEIDDMRSLIREENINNILN